MLRWLLPCLLVASCAVNNNYHVGPPERPSGGYLRPSTIVSRYAQLWNTMAPHADSHRALFQPAFSTRERAAVWVALPRELLRASPERIRREIRRWRLQIDGARIPLADEDIEISAHGTATLRFDLSIGHAVPSAVVTIDDGEDEHEVTLRFAPEDDAEFSFLAYSCNGPFGMDRPRVYPDGSSRGNDEFGVLATHVNSFNLLRERVSGGIRLMKPDGEEAPSPSFAVAMGDQIYVDADAEEDIEESLSLFHGSRSEISSVDLRRSEYNQRLLADIYRFHFSVPPLADAMSRLPVAMVWDDHEIRDGWGSQGDEDDPLWQQYFRDAQAVYGSYQLARNPQTETGKLVEFDWGTRTHVFMLDQRTHKTTERMMRPQDYVQLKTWFDRHASDEPQLFVLVSPIPLSSWTLGDILVGATGAGVSDDLRDRLDEHPSDQQQLMDTLVDYFSTHTRDRLLVLSGDLHRSAVIFLRMCEPGMECETDYTDERDGVLDFGWEIISSGIANDRHNNGFLSQMLVDSSENTGIGGTYGSDEGNQHTIVARARGGIANSPSFAEINVTMRDGWPQPSVVFYPSAWITGLSSTVLANDYRVLRGEAGVRTTDVWSNLIEESSDPGTRPAAQLGWVELPWNATAPRYSLRRNGEDVIDCIQYFSTACVSPMAGENTTDRWAGSPYPTGEEPARHDCGPAIPQCASLR